MNRYQLLVITIKKIEPSSAISAAAGDMVGEVGTFD